MRRRRPVPEIRKQKSDLGFRRSSICGKPQTMPQRPFLISVFWHLTSGTSRKEVIQPQVPLRLPCYDFTPVADLTVVG
jgi:hypothetical protein